jgi:4-amino-4-deoxy-L-arabinose transferase-like glycosyltransferase
MAGGTLSSSATTFSRRRLSEAALIAGALWYLGSYLVVAFARIGYPYDLEWMEGGSLEHVARVLRGQAVYVPPSLEFTPYIYGPLYYYVAAVFAKLFGLRLLSLRIVSLAASLGVFVLIALLVRQRTRSRLGALVAVGLFAALFERSGAFFDLARVDSLALFLTLFPVWLLLGSERHDVAAGVLLAAAVFTKQSMLLIGAPAVLARSWSLRGPQRLQCLAAFIAVAAGGSVVLHLCTHGWSTYYMFTLPASHSWVTDSWIGYWRDDLFIAVPVAMLALGFTIAGARRGFTIQAVELAVVFGCLAESWSSRMHSGSFSNVLMPVYACLAWQTGAVMGWLDESAPVPSKRALTDAPPAMVPDRPPSGIRRLFSRHGLLDPRSVHALAPWACLVQLALLWFPPWKQVPTAADRAAGAAFVAKLAAVPGPVLVPFHPHLARLAGKATYAQEMALFDVLRGGDRHAADALGAEIRRRLRAREFAAVIVDQDWWPTELSASYIRSQVLFPYESAVFWPRTGWPVRPRDLYEPRP